MFNDLAVYFHQKVWKDYKTYADTIKDGKSGVNNDLRLAIHAAESLYHLREHIPQVQQKSRDEIARTCPDYGLLGDIYNTAKHRSLTRGNPQVINAEDIYEQIALTKYEDKQGEFCYAEKLVLVNLNNGSTRDLYEVLTNVLNFWLNELHNLGVTVYPEPIDIESWRLPTREESQLSLEITKGLSFTMNFQLRRYNYETQSVEPIDLTDKEIRFNLTQMLPQSVDITIKDEETDEEIKQTIFLSEEQSHKLSEMNDNKEISEFLMKLATEQGVFSEAQ
jgi:hypothetical protein